jgi:hypothetical protein
LRKPLRWDVVLDHCFAHAVYPLVHRNLQELEFEGVPQPARNSLTTLTQLNALRAQLHEEDLRHALLLLGRAGIPVIPLKGVALAASLYGDASLRASSDLDVLVRPDDVSRAIDLLRADGYDAGEPYTLDQSDLDWLLRSNIEYGFVRRGRELATLLELHWDIAWRWQRQGRAAEDIWQRAERRDVLGIQAWALSPEWEVLYLMIHAARHHWHGLKWMVDIHELCIRGRVPWDAVHDIANAFGWDKAVRISLSVCALLFGTPVPERWAGAPPPDWAPLFPAPPPATDIWADALLPLRLLDRPGARLRYLSRVLLLPTLAERRAIRLPPALGALYYPLRPIRLGARWTWDRARAELRRFAAPASPR